MDIEENRSRADEILTIRIPRWAWDGIVTGIVRWADRDRDDIEILSAAEVEETDRG